MVLKYHIMALIVILLFLFSIESVEDSSDILRKTYTYNTNLRPRPYSERSNLDNNLILKYESGVVRIYIPSDINLDDMDLHGFNEIGIKIEKMITQFIPDNIGNYPINLLISSIHKRDSIAFEGIPLISIPTIFIVPYALGWEKYGEPRLFI